MFDFNICVHKSGSRLCWKTLFCKEADKYPATAFFIFSVRVLSDKPFFPSKMLFQNCQQNTKTCAQGCYLSNKAIAHYTKN